MNLPNSPINKEVVMNLPNYIKSECGDLCFKHLVGSALFNNTSKNSDVDWLCVHKSTFIWNPLYIHHYDHSIVSYTDFVNENLSIDMKNLVCAFTQVKEKQQIPHLSMILSHLYAIKYELITDIRDTEAFEFYLDWLQSPGNAGMFWNNIKNLSWRYLDTIPDNDRNWSQEFDDSEKHMECKKTWENLGLTRLPIVNKNLGYDNNQARRAFQDLFIIQSILLPNSMITDDQRNFLNRVRNGEVPFDEYKLAKKHIWKQTRLALESWHHIYFLGYGYSLEESQHKKVFGTRGIINLINRYLE